MCEIQSVFVFRCVWNT